jgi:hypothetical protein
MESPIMGRSMRGRPNHFNNPNLSWNLSFDVFLGGAYLRFTFAELDLISYAISAITVF